MSYNGSQDREKYISYRNIIRQDESYATSNPIRPINKPKGINAHCLPAHYGLYKGVVKIYENDTQAYTKKIDQRCEYEQDKFTYLKRNEKSCAQSSKCRLHTKNIK